MAATRDRPTQELDELAKLVVLFDGDCNLCDGLVGFVARRDRGKRLRFVPMSSLEGSALLAERGFAPGALDTFVVLAGERTLVRSDAALAIVRRLDGRWSWLRVARVLPRPLRDALYRWVARNRVAWFGRVSRGTAPACERP